MTGSNWVTIGIPQELKNWFILKALEEDRSSASNAMRAFMLYKGARELPDSELYVRARQMGKLGRLKKLARKLHSMEVICK